MRSNIKNISKLTFFFILIIVISLISTKGGSIKKKSSTDFSVIISSCDKYSELWDAHFKFLFQYWPSLNNKSIPIILTNNFKTFNNYNIINANLGEDVSWSDNMLKTLDLVKTKYVIILLEDYILDAPVDESRLINIITYMNKTNAAYTELYYDLGIFNPTLGKEKTKNYAQGIDNLIIRSNNSYYRTSLQACVWEVDALKKILKSGESPWEFEQIGTERSRKINHPFYMVMEKNVISYKNAVEKGSYHQDVVDYINNNGIVFDPKKSLLIDHYSNQ